MPDRGVIYDRQALVPWADSEAGGVESAAAALKRREHVTLDAVELALRGRRWFQNVAPSDQAQVVLSIHRMHAELGALLPFGG